MGERNNEIMKELIFIVLKELVWILMVKLILQEQQNLCPLLQPSVVIKKGNVLEIFSGHSGGPWRRTALGSSRL